MPAFGVYFIGPASGRFVKIGMTGQLRGRLDALQTGHPQPLEVLRWLPTPSRSIAKAVEDRFHHYLSPYRAEGEWFERTESVDSEMTAEHVYVGCPGDCEMGVITLAPQFWYANCTCPEVTHHSCSMCSRPDLRPDRPHLTDPKTKVTICSECFATLSRHRPRMRQFAADVTESLAIEAQVAVDIGPERYWHHNLFRAPPPLFV